MWGIPVGNGKANVIDVLAGILCSVGLAAMAFIAFVWAVDLPAPPFGDFLSPAVFVIMILVALVGLHAFFAWLGFAHKRPGLGIGVVTVGSLVVLFLSMCAFLLVAFAGW